MKLKGRYKRLLILVTLLFVTIISFIFLSFSKATEVKTIADGSRVAVNSELTYYLKVSYDGIDRLSYDSRVPTEENIKSKLFSGYIYVEDKIPDGLTFKSFKISEDGTIGAVNSVTGKVCTGTVYNDTKHEEESNTNMSGLHYDESTRTVTFKVKDLQAGCNLTIGIVTQTPPTTDNPATPEIELRKDFYNYATAREEYLTKQSNTVHVWMGMEGIDVYDVEYQYAEGTPDNAPQLPPTLQYTEGTAINVATDPYIEGYRFLGWTTSDATITSGTFRMPAKKVTLTGSFEKITPYKVTYEIEGDMPEGYIVPSEKEYYSGDIVSRDILEKGTVFNGYRFLGWELAEGNIELNEYNDFVMPESNVKFVGKFELVTYKVEYQFYDNVLPPNHETLLPEIKEYRPGDTVTLEYPIEVEGYTFLGWYKEDNFEMPEEDIVIYGDWAQISFYDVKIEKKVLNSQSYYRVGDIVTYAVVVTNPNSFEINNVTVLEDTAGSYFVDMPGITYTIVDDKTVEIPTIGANESVTLYANYEVKRSDKTAVSNIAEVIGATAEEPNELDVREEYKAQAGAKIQSELTVCSTVTSKKNDSKKFQYHITDDSDYDLWLTISNGECTTIFINPGTYNIKEVVPQEYTLESIRVNPDNSSTTSNDTITFTIQDGENSDVTFTNSYKKKGFYHSSGNVENDVVCDAVFRFTKECAYLDNKKSPYVTSETGIDFTKYSSDTNGKGLYVYAGTEDDEYPIIYYRGAVDDNNVIFADYCWKIVRSTETGGTKLIYNGVSTNGTCNNTGTASQIGTSIFNSDAKDVKYMGYMYDISSSSIIKTFIDSWYKNNLNDYDSYFEDTVWCVDRNGSEKLGSYIYTGFGIRIYLYNQKPLINCPLQEDSYTLRKDAKNYNSSLNGNALLEYSVALLTGDEAQLSGYALTRENDNQYSTDSYIYTDSTFWFLSPINFEVSGGVSFSPNQGRLGMSVVDTAQGVRPSISLRKEVTYSRGNGTVNNPYIVE